MFWEPGTTMRVVEVPPERSTMVTVNATRGRGNWSMCQPGGQSIGRPPSTCTWAWKTVWCAAAPVFSTIR